jgi:arabinogalactan endo-1,4-beta-galactosidase
MSLFARFILLLSFIQLNILPAQEFYLGADLSYVNEMEDCGAVYKDNGQAKDPYAIFAGHGCDLVRLRLWHTPAWYDQLNEGRRYSDLADVRRSIQRAKNQGMKVLLDFHLSDNWADPAKQVIPQAWNAVVDDLPVLKDSLYNYIYRTLTSLQTDGLLPEMVQIGNETNKGILLSQAVNDAGWVLEWDRNSQLFNAAIRAVRAVETETGSQIEVVIHAAGPDNAGWIFDQFIQNEVTDFDIMGISYYWAWHKPATIASTGEIIESLRAKHPGYEVMIVETGYIWTTEGQDQANNIISEVHPDYSPAGPDAQRRWLVDLSEEVKVSGGLGVIYWEPAWVSTSCFTQWGQGSHQEHAAFFDFDHNVLPGGGMAWFGYDDATSAEETPPASPIRIYPDSSQRQLIVEWEGAPVNGSAVIDLIDASGRTLSSQRADSGSFASGARLRLPELTTGVYFVVIRQKGKIWAREKIWIGH